jgi:thiol-disulfide isomerase/thioredoxin
MKKVLLILSLSVAAGWFWFNRAAASDETLLFPEDAAYFGQVGRPAEVAFTALDGRKVNLAEMKGHVVVLDFWATWCGPCMQEMPHVKATFEKYHSRGLEIVGISFDRDRQILQSVVKESGIPWPQYFEEGQGNNVFGLKFGIRHYPSMWLVDKKGVVRFISAGRDMEKKIEALLAENPDQKPLSLTNPVGFLDRAKEVVASVKSRNETDSTKDSGPTGGATSLVAAISRFASNTPRSSDERPAGLHAVRLKGVLASASKPMAMLEADGHAFSLVPGEEMKVKIGELIVPVRCDAIDGARVTLSTSNGVVKSELLLTQIAGVEPRP